MQQGYYKCTSVQMEAKNCGETQRDLQLPMLRQLQSSLLESRSLPSCIPPQSLYTHIHYCNSCAAGSSWNPASRVFCFCGAGALIGLKLGLHQAGKKAKEDRH